MELKYFLMCLKASISYIPQNFLLAFSALAVCIVLGTLMSLARVNKVPVMNQVCSALLAIGKALPTNLVLLICMLLYTSYFGKIIKALNLNINIKNISMNWVAIFALIICVLPNTAETIRSGLIAVDKGQYEAGYSIGLSRSQTFFHIILPQAIRIIIPPMTSNVLAVFKTTALVSVIGVFDILNGAIVAASKSYCYLEAYTAAALVFWVIGFVLEKLSKYIEQYFTRSVKTVV